jgi:predicted site-specific integrase-resolvase
VLALACQALYEWTEIDCPVLDPDSLVDMSAPAVVEHLLIGYGVTVVYTGQAEDESAESELVRDMLATVTSLAGRRYGQRSAKTKRLRAAVSAETECGDAA